VIAQVEIRDRSGADARCIRDNGFCPDWIADNLDRYADPFVQHVVLTLVSVGLGFVIAFVLALIAHRRRWLVGPVTNVTGILYTIPSLALFFLLLPLTGRGTVTAVIALTSYTLLILFRNIVAGLDAVPEEARDAGRGMGLTERQLLWRVELPLALPEIMLGVNQTILMALAMIIICAMIGTRDLGQEVFIALSKADSGRGIVAGLAIAFIGIIADRLLGGWSAKARARLG
jgi:osmoprotectant transport system permease protein